MNISDIANYAQIISIPLTILLWLITRERFVKFWKKWFVLISVIVLIIGLIGLWKANLLKWLQYQITWPVWALILLSLSGLVIASLIRALTDSLGRIPEHFLYISDNVFGVEWHWRYQEGKLYEKYFEPFCPNVECSCILEPVRRSAYQAIDDVALVCDRCGFTKDFEYNWDQLRWKVVKEIDRRIRTGEFKKVLYS